MRKYHLKGLAVISMCILLIGVGCTDETKLSIGQEKPIWFEYQVNKTDPYTLNTISIISYELVIPERSDVKIIDSSLYVENSVEGWAFPLIIDGDPKELPTEIGSKFVIVFSVPVELLDFSNNEELTFKLNMELEVDGYPINFFD